MKPELRGIWVDLDNTLLWTWQPLITIPLPAKLTGLSMKTSPPSLDGRRRLRRVAIPGYRSVYACARRCAQPFLAALRKLAPVRMLTSASRGYAEAMSSAFELGFRPSGILAREEFGVSVDSQGVLVENRPEYDDDYRHYQRQSLKFLHLGRHAKLVEVPYFCGQIDDPFDHDWQRCVEEVERVLHRKRKIINPVERRRRDILKQPIFQRFARRLASSRGLPHLKAQQRLDQSETRIGNSQ